MFENENPDDEPDLNDIFENDDLDELDDFEEVADIDTRNTDDTEREGASAIEDTDTSDGGFIFDTGTDTDSEASTSHSTRSTNQRDSTGSHTASAHHTEQHTHSDTAAEQSSAQSLPARFSSYLPSTPSSTDNDPSKIQRLKTTVKRIFMKIMRVPIFALSFLATVLSPVVIFVVCLWLIDTLRRMWMENPYSFSTGMLYLISIPLLFGIIACVFAWFALWDWVDS